MLILDEPTRPQRGETRRLFGILRELSADGITIIYVSHRLEEVFDIADRITVMRNGGVVMTVERTEATMAQVVVAMVGTSPDALFPARPGRQVRVEDAAPSVVVAGLTVDAELTDISFQAHPGEIIGLAGLEGSGVATLLGVLFGTRRARAGTIAFADGRGAPSSPTAAARRGISLVPADRRHQGLMLESSSTEHQPGLGRCFGGRRPWLDRGPMRAAARRRSTAAHPADGPAAIVGRLSGATTEVVVGKWLEISRQSSCWDPPRG